MPLSLNTFCDEMQRLAGLIEAPANWVPGCGQNRRAVYNVSIDEGGQRYVFTFRERNDAEVLIESADKDLVMERIFVEITKNMAVEAVARSEPGLDEESAKMLADLTPLKIGDWAVDFQINFAQAQDELLGRVNKNWQKRQALRNAQKLQQTKDLFGE